jgi:hypothetical protein
VVVQAYNPAIGKLRQKGLEFETSLGYTGRPYLKKKKKDR